MLYVDCFRVSEEYFPDPQGLIDVNGQIYISKQSDSLRTVPVSCEIVYNFLDGY